MDSRFNFNGYDLSTCNNFQYAESLTFPSKQAPNTATDDTTMIDEPLYMKSAHNLTNSYEISFEDNFMKEHETVFKRELRNYMESVRIFLEDYDQKILKRFPEGLYDIGSNMTFEEVLMMTGSEMSEQTKNKFVGECKHYEKLGEFLNVVADSCPSEIAVELIQASQQILEQFLMSQHKENVYVQSFTMLELALTKAKALEGIRILDLSILSPSSSQLANKFSRFIEVYCTTTIMVIGRFFQNPFSGDSDFNGFKRSLSPFSLEDDEDESVEISPQKKRKFSF